MKKTIIRTGDYELYRFFMPWKFLFSHEENRFILSELEKQHPRFSATCCYDTKFSLRKKQVLAEVVVMEKSSLASYRNCGGKLFIEEDKKRSVFSSRNKFLRYATLLLIIIAGILSFRIAKTALKTGNETTVEESMNFAFEDNTEKEVLLPDAEKVMTGFFSSVSAAKGKVSSFSYGNGKCRFSIYGCHTENIANARYCVVSFKDNEPFFDMELPFAEKEDLPNAIQSGQVQISRFAPESEGAEIALVRKKLMEFGAKIETEHNGEESAKFAFSVNRSYLYSSLKVCGSSSKMLGWKEKSLSVSEKSDICRVQVEFKKNENSDFSVMEHLAKYAFLFGTEALKIAPPKNTLFAVPNSRVFRPATEREIGRIRKKDGSVLICFRNKDGKTSYKQEAANAE